jgi:hypothetical protein
MGQRALGQAVLQKRDPVGETDSPQKRNVVIIGRKRRM